MNNFIEFTKELNDYAKNYNLDKEIILEEDIIKAIYYINNLFIENELDVLIFLSSMNLCNTYIKQNKDNISYSFKKGISTLINIVNEYKINNLKISKTNDSGNLYIFELGYIQFSFHDDKKVEIDNYYYKELKWDGIRKQPCAKTLFEKIINNDLSKKALTMNGENIYDNINELINNYKNNRLSFKDIINN